MCIRDRCQGARSAGKQHRGRCELLTLWVSGSIRRPRQDASQQVAEKGHTHATAQQVARLNAWDRHVFKARAKMA
eukprot:5884266-Alexandrium_andersonii.AAC.1